MKRLILIVWLLALLCLPAAAEENYDALLEASGAQTLSGQLPGDVQELLRSLPGDPLQPETYTELSFSRVMQQLLSLLTRQKSAPVQVFFSLTAVVVLAAMGSGLEGITADLSLRQTYHTVSVLASCGLLLTPFVSLLTTVRQTVDSVSVFMLSYVPVYGAILAAGGAPAGAVSYQTTLLAAAELLVQFIRAVVLPALTVSLALGCTGTVTEGFSLDALSAGIYKAILWAMGLFTTVFTGVLSVQQMVAAAGDTLSGRAMKFSLSSFVPVVGGALSEAYSTVVGCAGLLRSTVGCFGLAATALILLPPLIACLCWNFCLHMAAGTAALFQLGQLEKLCRTVAGAVRVLIGVLAVFALLMILSTSVIAFVGKGGGV
mgnify:FL=1